MRNYIEHEKQREHLKNTITQLEQVLERDTTTKQNIQDLQIVYNNEDILNYFIRMHNEAKKEVIYVIQVRYGSFNSELDDRTVYSLINNLVGLLKRGISVKVIYPESPYLNFFSLIATSIQEETLNYIYGFQVRIEAQPIERKQMVDMDKLEQKAGSEAEEEGPKQIKTDKVVGRNDLCPCGSGKKYKKCCGKDRV